MSSGGPAVVPCTGPHGSKTRPWVQILNCESLGKLEQAYDNNMNKKRNLTVMHALDAVV